jgi:hypothetical protein
MNPLLEFIQGSYQDHVIFYNGKIVSLSQFPRKEQFKIGCRRVHDNSPIGWIKTPEGTYFEVNRTRKLAVKTSSQQILATMGETDEILEK